MSDINPESLRGLESSSTCRGACNPPHWSESRSITNADNTRFPPDGRDLHPQPLSGKKSNSINILEKWRTRDITIKRERERWELYSRAFWEAAVLSGLSGCQDEAKVHRWSATETADAEHLVFPDLSLLISLSLPAFTHARSTWLSASSADLISLSLSLSLWGCYGNYILVLQAFSPGRGAWIWYWNSFTVSPPKTRRQNACWENVSAEKPHRRVVSLHFLYVQYFLCWLLVYFVVWLLSHLWDTECDQELAG